MVADRMDIDCSSRAPSPAPGSPMRSRPSTPRLVPLQVPPPKGVHQRNRLQKRNRDVEMLSDYTNMYEPIPDGEYLLNRPMVKRKKITSVELIPTVESHSPIPVVHHAPPATAINEQAIAPITDNPILPNITAMDYRRPRSSSGSSIVGLVFTAEPPTTPITTPASLAPGVLVSTPPPCTPGSTRISHVPSPLAIAPVVTPAMDEEDPIINALSMQRAISAPALTNDMVKDPVSIPTPQPVVFGTPSTILPGVSDSDLVTQLAKTKQKLLASEVEHLSVEMNKVFALGYGRGMTRGVGGSRRPSRLRDGVGEGMRRAASADDGMGTGQGMDLDE